MTAHKHAAQGRADVYRFQYQVPYDSHPIDQDFFVAVTPDIPDTLETYCDVDLEHSSASPRIVGWLPSGYDALWSTGTLVCLHTNVWRHSAQKFGPVREYKKWDKI